MISDRSWVVSESAPHIKGHHAPLGSSHIHFVSSPPLADSASTRNFFYDYSRDAECCDFLRLDIFVGGEFLSLTSLDIHRFSQTKVSLVQLWYDIISCMDSRI